jgi:hypothetical protein
VAVATQLREAVMRGHAQRLAAREWPQAGAGARVAFEPIVRALATKRWDTMGKGKQPACQALILLEVTTVPECSPLLLAHALPELGEYAKDALSTSFPEDSAITNDLVPPAL